MSAKLMIVFTLTGINYLFVAYFTIGTSPIVIIFVPCEKPYFLLNFLHLFPIDLFSYFQPKNVLFVGATTDSGKVTIFCSFLFKV